MSQHKATLGGGETDAGFPSPVSEWESEPESRPQRKQVEVRLGGIPFLVHAGFTQKQALHVLEILADRGQYMHIEAVHKWVRLLQRLQVEDPIEVIARSPLVLTSKPETAGTRAEGLVPWLLSMGVSPDQIPLLLSKSPLLLNVSHTTAADAADWLSRELGWSGAQIAHTLTSRYSNVFALSPSRTLAPKLAWFISQGVSLETMSRVFYNSPSLFSNTVERNEAQLRALHALGFSKSQVTDILLKMPLLVSVKVSGLTVQAKVRFLTQVMGKPVEAIFSCPSYLTYSLTARIGPRWAFTQLYSSSKVFVLSTKICAVDEDFVKDMVSDSLDAECLRRDLTRLQLYKECVDQWPQGEGKMWVVEKKLKRSYKVSGSVSVDSISPEDSTALQ